MVSCWMSVCPSVCPLVSCLSVHFYFHFQMITSKYQWIFTKLGMYIDIVKLMGKFCHFLTELFAH